MTNRLFVWVEPAEQIEDMRQSLEATCKALEKDKQYRMARPEITEPLLYEAENYIKQAAAILQRDPDLKGDSFIAFKASMRLAFRDMQMALHDPAVAHGTPKWLHLKESGKKGADARWGDRRLLNELYLQYAARRDAFGLSKPSELFYSFVGDCDVAGIEPPIMKTFRNQLAAVRKENGLK
jgi:hypothetical protein